MQWKREELDQLLDVVQLVGDAKLLVEHVILQLEFALAPRLRCEDVV